MAVHQVAQNFRLPILYKCNTNNPLIIIVIGFRSVWLVYNVYNAVYNYFMFDIEQL